MTKGKFRPMLFAVITWMHIMALVAVWYGFKYGFTLSAWVWFFGLYTLRSIGVSLGNHRLFTHRSFKCHFLTEVILNFFAGMAAQGPLLKWVLDHDQHHQDTEGGWDPHTPTRYRGLKGFMWAHVWWLFFEVNRPTEALAVISARKNIRIAKWDRWTNPIAILSGFVLPFYFEGVPGLLLAGFAGVVFSWNITWCVNSVCHVFGSADESFRKATDDSKNNWPLALIFWIGEAWHSYHHEKADSAFLGWKWYHPDLGKWILVCGEAFGIFWDIKRPPVIAR